MDYLHQKLLQKIPMYKAWHDSPLHKIAHWGIFLLVALLSTHGLINAINETPVAYAAGPDVQYTFDGNGLQTLSYNSQSYLSTPPGSGSQIVTAVFQTPGDTQNTYSPAISSAVVTTGSNYLQQVYRSGQSDSFTVKMTFSTTSANTLETDVSVTNNDSTDTLESVSLEGFFDLTTPDTPTSPTTWFNGVNNIGIGSLGGGTNGFGPAPVEFLQGDWGTLALSSDSYANNWTFGSVTFYAGSGSSDVFLMDLKNSGSNGGAAANAASSPIAPGQTTTYTYYVSFGSTSVTDPTSIVPSQAYTAWRTAYPYLVNWANHDAPIARWFMADGTRATSTDPRGYFVDAGYTGNVTDQASFSAYALGQAANVISRMNAMNPRPQALLIWDLEGQEFDQPFTYVGNPNELNTISPEMGAVADQIISNIQAAGYQVGLTLRPQTFGAGPSLPSTCTHDPDNNADSDVYVLTTATWPYRGYICSATNTWTQPGANLPAQQTSSDLDSVVLSNLEGKVAYAESRWGIHIFYVDSVVYGDAGTAFSYRMWRQLETDYPNCIFFPEEAQYLTYGATAPYTVDASGASITGYNTPQSVLDIYPNAFSMIEPYDIDLTTDSAGVVNFNNLLQSVQAGNLLFIEGWWDDPDNGAVQQIYQDAGYSNSSSSPTVTDPTVTVSAASSITTTSATLNGSITADGGASSTIRGFNYGTNTSYGSVSSTNGTYGVGSFSANITSLTCNTTYHFEAFATNSTGTGTSGDQTFTTSACAASPPTLTTSAVTSVATSTMTVNANISATGGASITQSGFAYGTSATLSSVIATTTLGSQGGTGNFSQSLNGLTPGTLYYFRAYAVNSAGTSTGSILSTTTVGVAIPTLTTQAASGVTTIGATLNGTITATGNLGITQSGFAYGTSATLSSVIATTTLGAQAGTGSFSSAVSSLTCNTTYYFRPYAINLQGTGVGSIVSFTTSACVPTVTAQAASSLATTSATLNGDITSTGGANASIRGFEYGTTVSYGSLTSTSGSYGTGAYAITVTTLTCATTYHYRAYATNSTGTASSSDQSFTTSGCPVNVVAPTLSSPSATSVGTSTATLNGSITADGGASSTIRGFNYGTNTSYGSVSSTNGTYGVGSFSANITGLTCNTTYHFEAFAVNSYGTGVSTDATFTTSSCPATLTVSGSSASSITATSATLNGSIVTAGLLSVTAEGFDWGTDTTYGTIDSNLGLFSAGSFTDNLSTLTCNTTYHYEFFAVNVSGTASSSDQSFVSSPCPSSGGGSSGGGGGGGGSVSSGGGGGGTSSGGGISTTALSSTSGTSTCTTTPAKMVSLPPVALSLREGSTGTAVSNLQTYLVTMGYLPSPDVTGYYGSLTKAAVAAYIAASTPITSCPVTTTTTSGVATPLCPQGLTCTPLSSTPSTESSEPSIPASLLDLTYGSSGPSVVSLQDSLITYGYLASGYNTGFYGTLTKAAVAKYLSGVGTVASSISMSGSIPLFTRPLTMGSTGTDVKNLQIFLNGRGFTVAVSGNGSPGHETTYFGPATKAAVIKFQDAYASSILTPYELTKGTGYFGMASIKTANALLK